ncbi:hypothetical protein LUZ62_066497 [Rhynchospora pubera]|uniref:Uncharacterized protein n=1 Tax=Rhynchospora pubera TaxID=906938 RepID=A0AAV8ELE2_9POAL|nr:hypothetical protein LUZ62_066497 [Rhynchospora pubera]
MDNFSWLTAAGLDFLTFNSGMAIYRSSHGDAGSVAFDVVSFVNLLLLFSCLRMYERSPHNYSQRQTIKSAVWSLTTLLTVMFSYKVAALMPLAVELVVWTGMASATILGGGFYAFFIYKDKNHNNP